MNSESVKCGQAKECNEFVGAALLEGRKEENIPKPHGVITIVVFIQVNICNAFYLWRVFRVPVSDFLAICLSPDAINALASGPSNWTGQGPMFRAMHVEGTNIFT